MADQWAEVSIDQIATKISMGPFGSDIKTDNFVPSGVPVIRGGNLTSGRFNGTDFVFLTEEKAQQLANSNAFPGDLVFTHRGTLGQVGLIPAEPYDRYVVSQSQMLLRCDPIAADSSFIYYFFKSNIGQHALLMNASQTGVPAISRPTTSLKGIRLWLPPLPEQRAIAAILGALDDKIDLNRRMNETLEAMARALFKDWFVDFGPTRAKMEGREPYLAPELWALFPDRLDEDGKPEGWWTQPLDSIANFLNGLAMQRYPASNLEDSFPVIKIAELRNGLSVRTDRASRDVPEEYRVNNGDFLFSWSGSLLAKFWTEGEGALNQHLFKVTSDRYPMWFVSQWVHHYLDEFQTIAASKATTMGHIQRSHLKAAMTVCPPPDALPVFGGLPAPLMDRTIKNDLEAHNLAAIRDLLLPQLMSGKVRVRVVERTVGDVT